jgi:hypothetical protein
MNEFQNSDYCYGVELQQAIQRHERGEARVIPIILRSVYWQIDTLKKLQVLPKDAKAVTDPGWHDLDSAFYNVAEGIVKVIQQINKRSSVSPFERRMAPSARPLSP